MTPLRMIDAVQAVDERMERLTGPDTDETVVKLDHSRWLCSGTDVPADELLLLVSRDVADRLEAAEGSVCHHGARCQANCVLEGEVRGVAMRLFWLGYEFGKADDS